MFSLPSSSLLLKLPDDDDDDDDDDDVEDDNDNDNDVGEDHDDDDEIMMMMMMMIRMVITSQWQASMSILTPKTQIIMISLSSNVKVIPLKVVFG